MSSATPTTVRPPLALVAVAGVVLAAGIVMSIVGAFTTGLSVDDPRHSTRLNSYFTDGLYVTKNETARSIYDMPREAFVYGPVTALLQHEANELVGNENRRWTSRTESAYTTRHVVVALLSLVGLLATGAAATLLLGDWRWGVVSAGALAAIPLWTGHAMFNGKDSTVATGHIVATLGLLMFALGRKRSEVWQALAGLVLAGGTVLMLGTRPGMWTSLAASVTILLGVLWWSRELRWRTSLWMLGSLIFAYFWLGVAYPRIYKLPVQMLLHSAIGSGTYEHLSNPNHRMYLPVHLLEEWPLILLGLMLFGTLAAIVRSWVLLRERSADAVGLLLLGSQAVTLPLLGILMGSAFYQGIRQVLFATPAQAILATYGLAAIFAIARTTRMRAIWAVVAGLGLILPTISQATLFPYQYSYQNVAADAFGVDIDNDYLGTSYRALMPHLEEPIKVVCPQFRHSRGREIGDCRTRKRGQLSAYWLATGKPALDKPVKQEYYSLWRGKWYIPDTCRVTYNLVRHRNFHEVVISRILRCEPKKR